jgi:hypothetical protein
MKLTGVLDIAGAVGVVTVTACSLLSPTATGVAETADLEGVVVLALHPASAAAMNTNGPIERFM